MGILEDIFTAALWGKEPPTAPSWVEWIHMPRKDKAGSVSFNSGWMVYPDGHIHNYAIWR